MKFILIILFLICFQDIISILRRDYESKHFSMGFTIKKTNKNIKSKIIIY